MFGFQRIGDLIWAAADERARGFLLGATSGRTTLNGEGLQHEDGQSQVLRFRRAQLHLLRPHLQLRGGCHPPRGTPSHVPKRGGYFTTSRSSTKTMPIQPSLLVRRTEYCGGCTACVRAPARSRPEFSCSGVGPFSARCWQLPSCWKPTTAWPPTSGASPASTSWDATPRQRSAGTGSTPKSPHG